MSLEAALAENTAAMKDLTAALLKGGFTGSGPTGEKAEKSGKAEKTEKAEPARDKRFDNPVYVAVHDFVREGKVAGEIEARAQFIARMREHLKYDTTPDIPEKFLKTVERWIKVYKSNEGVVDFDAD